MPLHITFRPFMVQLFISLLTWPNKFHWCRGQFMLVVSIWTYVSIRILENFVLDDSNTFLDQNYYQTSSLTTCDQNSLFWKSTFFFAGCAPSARSLNFLNIIIIITWTFVNKYFHWFMFQSFRGGSHALTCNFSLVYRLVPWPNKFHGIRGGSYALTYYFSAVYGLVSCSSKSQSFRGGSHALTCNFSLIYRLVPWPNKFHGIRGGSYALTYYFSAVYGLVSCSSMHQWN